VRSDRKVSEKGRKLSMLVWKRVKADNSSNLILDNIYVFQCLKHVKIANTSRL